MIDEKVFTNIKDFKHEINELNRELSYYHDIMYDCYDDPKARDIYFSKMTSVKAKIDNLYLDYPEYVL